MKKPTNAFRMNRRMVLRGAGGLMLGLPLLETFMPRKASAQTADALAVRAHRRGRQRRGSGGRHPEREHRAGEVLADGDGSADQGQHDRGQGHAVDRRARRLRGQAAHRQRHQPPLQLERAARIRPPTRRSSRPRRSPPAARTARPWGSRSTPRSRRRRIRPGATRSCCHAGMFSPGGTGFDIPGYVSYVTPQQPRVYIDSPYKAYQADHRRGRQRHDRDARRRRRPRCSGPRAARASTTFSVRRSRRC